jgi:adenylate cyclase
MAGDEGRHFAQVLERRVWRYAILANLLGAGVAVVNSLLWGPIFVTDRPSGPPIAKTMAIVCVYMLVAVVLSPLQVRRQFKPVRRWLAAERPPTTEERAAALRLPALAAANGTIWWIGSAVLLVILEPLVLGAHFPLIKSEIGIIACATTAAALTYLLVERVMRPLYAVLLAGEMARPPVHMGVTARLLLVWAMVSAAPLFGIAVYFVGLSPQQRLEAPPVLIVTCILAGITGLVVTLPAARSIADPLREIREALGRVESGDLDVELDVDDTGEVGLVQSGFNRMVAELRERQRMQELFGRHVGRQVAEQALRGTSRLGGERREATVLFVDVIGSTQLSNRKSPDQVVTLLNDLFAAVVRCVADEGGFVNKFMGDGALCVFGALGDTHDHATRALRAARCLQDEVQALQDIDEDFDVAIGVSTGDVVAGNVGAEDRYEYTVIGDAVNEASRLTEEAKVYPSRLLASRHTIRTSSDDERTFWTQTGSTILRGRMAPTHLYTPEAVA